MFFIYFRAAARETRTYPADVRARVARERAVTVLGQLSILAAIATLAGGWIAFKVYVVPYFLVFPVAFVLDESGQRYDRTVSGQWSTLMAPSRWWDFAYLWSSYHLEHHYFPNVPFYNLRRLGPAFFPRARHMTRRRTGTWYGSGSMLNRPPARELGRARRGFWRCFVRRVPGQS